MYTMDYDGWLCPRYQSGYVWPYFLARYMPMGRNVYGQYGFDAKHPFYVQATRQSIIRRRPGTGQTML